MWIESIENVVAIEAVTHSDEPNGLFMPVLPDGGRSSNALTNGVCYVNEVD